MGLVIVPADLMTSASLKALLESSDVFLTFIPMKLCPLPHEARVSSEFFIVPDLLLYNTLDIHLL